MDEKPINSGWWILYHSWCGICFKVFADVSGITDYFTDSQNISNPGSSSIYATTFTFYTIALFGLGYTFSKVVINSINENNMNSKNKTLIKFILPFVYLAVSAVLAALISPIFAASEHSLTNSKSESHSSEIKPVKAYTAIQSSEGVTNADLNQAWLSNFEAWSVEIIKKNGRLEFERLGQDPKNLIRRYLPAHYT